jgi:hypothetical protein
MKKIVVTFFITKIELTNEYKSNNPFKPMNFFIGSFVIGVFLLVFNQKSRLNIIEVNQHLFSR